MSLDILTTILVAESFACLLIGVAAGRLVRAQWFGPWPPGARLFSTVLRTLSLFGAPAAGMVLTVAVAVTVVMIFAEFVLEKWWGEFAVLIGRRPNNDNHLVELVGKLYAQKKDGAP